ncbi:MAG: tetratricopeptide repeat protein [bacterium]
MEASSNARSARVVRSRESQISPSRYAGMENDGSRLRASLNRGNGAAHLLLGKSYYATKDFHAAEIELRNAVRLCPNSAEAHKLLGESLSKQGGYNRHAEAMGEFQKALLLEKRK